VLAFERRLCWDVWLRNEGCVLNVVALEVVGRRGASVNGSLWTRADGMIVLTYVFVVDLLLDEVAERCEIGVFRPQLK
jgi:hypothetical protein